MADGGRISQRPYHQPPTQPHLTGLAAGASSVSDSTAEDVGGVDGCLLGDSEGPVDGCVPSGTVKIDMDIDIGTDM